MGYNDFIFYDLQTGHKIYDLWAGHTISDQLVGLLMVGRLVIPIIRFFIFRCQ